MAITEQDFIAYFEDKKSGTYECPFCKTVHFSVLRNWQHGPAELQTWFIPAPGIAQNGFHTAYAIMCNNCGRIDYFNAPAIEVWKAMRGGGQS